MTPAREQQLLEVIARQRADIDRLTLENHLLREKVNLMLARLFGKSSETSDLSQPDLFDSDAAKKALAAAPADPGPAVEPVPAKKRSPRKPRDISHLEIRETVVIDDEVIRPLVQQGKLRGYQASPKYHDRSHVPISIEIVATGVLATETKEDGTVTRRFVAGPARDFVMVADDDYAPLSQEVFVRVRDGVL